MTRPALLLDVDGVLCPFDQAEGYTQYSYSARSDLQYIWISPANTLRLARLAETFDLIWCTGWEHQANEHLLELHGLEAPLPVIEFFRSAVPGVTLKFSGHSIEDNRFKMVHWKVPWIEAWAIENNRPFAWIDDEIEPGTVKWAEALSESSEIPILALPTASSQGMTDDHVDTLFTWWRDKRPQDPSTTE